MALLDHAAQRLLERLRLRVRPAVASTDQGSQRSDRHASGLEFVGHREYVPGDDARRIDWQAFARSRTLTIRTYEAERDARVYVLVDVSASMARGEPPKLDVARRVAAAFGYLGMNQADRVQVVPFADAVAPMPRALRRKDQYPELEAFLNALDARGATTFQRTARAFVERFPARGLLVVVSDLMEAAEWGDSLRHLGKSGHQLCVVRVRCDEDHAPAFRGELELTDAETGAVLRLTATRELLEAYRAEVAEHVERTRDACRRAGGRFVDAPVELPFDQLVRRVLAPALEPA